MKIAVFVPIWGRREVLDIFALGIERLQNSFDVEFNVCAVVSEDWAMDYCRDKRWDFTTALNSPLGRKLNKGIEFVLYKDWDYMLQMGSDNLVSNELMERYLEKTEEGKHLFGVKQCGLVNSKTGKFKLFDYGAMIGAGRMWSYESLEASAKRVTVKLKETLARIGSKGDEIDIPVCNLNSYTEIIGQEYIGLFDDDKERCVDRNSQNRMPLKVHVGSEELLIDKPLILDIKTDDNLWAYDRFEDEEHDFKELKNHYSKEELDKIWQGTLAEQTAE